MPRLYAPPTSNAQAPAPKVANIIDEISCELWKAQKDHLGLVDPYVITVLLSLQIEDNLDLTPSFNFIHPIGTGSHNRTTSISGDIGGDRKRVFTTTYYLDSQKLKNDRCGEDRIGHQKLLTLTGDLGLADIVRDGDATIAREDGQSHTPTSGEDKAIPTYGSTVQFIVTGGMTGLGPIWTLQRFKGPGGDKGLLNGKRVRTDSITITFAKQYIKPTALQQAADDNLLHEQAGASKTGDELAKAKGRSRALAAATANEKGRLKASLRLRNAPRVQAALTARLADLDAQTDAADTAVVEAQARDVSARREVDAAASHVEAVKQTETILAPAAATAAGQNLLNTMVLQNLNIQPR